MRASNAVTIEVTKEHFLTPRGDCIVAISSTKGAADLSEDFKNAARNVEARIILVFEVGCERFSVSGRGDPRLTFLDPHDIVVRKSTFISDRTIMILADKAAKDMPRSMVDKLRNRDCVLAVSLEVEV